MRKNVKSELLNKLKKSVPVLIQAPSDSLLFIIDGGYLLHKYVWDSKATYNEICLAYIKFIHDHYVQAAVVVFDGYNSIISTKGGEQRRRASKKNSPDILFDANMQPTVSQESFLQNPKNNLVSSQC